MVETSTGPSSDGRIAFAEPLRMLIGGEWVAGGQGTIEVLDPSSAEPFAAIGAASAADVDQAVAAARAAFEQGRWTGLAASKRAQILWRVAELIDQQADELAVLETLDNGKPITAARNMDLPAAAAAFRYWAGWCSKLDGRSPAVDAPGEYVSVALREPIGVVALIVPWNFPLVNAAVKVAPALAAGCTVVLKPAELTSLTAIRLGQILLDAGVPAGVVNVVTGHGREAGAALAAHDDVDKISFTGSTAVGKDLLVAARGNLKRLTLELGGKSPNFILGDADLGKAIAAAANGIFRNAGQMCAAASRLYVARERYDEVLTGLIAQARSFRLGPGIDPQTTMGPLVSQLQQRRVLDFVAEAREQGATIACGGHAHGSVGYFVEPTIVADARPDSRIVREEIFGPVLVVTPLDDADAIPAIANDSIYGLSANIWTRDVAAAHRVARRIRAGTITINSGMIVSPHLPFGGFKQSGWGREGGTDGIEAFTEIKTIITALQ